MNSTYKDQEIVGIDLDGCIVQWDGEKCEEYNCGETPEQFGMDSIFPHELVRISAA